MSTSTEPGHVTSYSFEVDEGKWEAWKNTVPRAKALDTRIIELLEADTEGRVLDSELNLAELTDTLDRALEELPKSTPGRGTVEDARYMLEGAKNE